MRVTAVASIYESPPARADANGWKETGICREAVRHPPQRSPIVNAAASGRGRALAWVVVAALTTLSPCPAVAEAISVGSGRFAAQAPEWLSLRVFDSARGLPQNSVLALAQDSRGVLYVGTEAGLARYDGVEWQAIELPSNANCGAVGALAALPDGSLLIGTFACGLCHLPEGRMTANHVGLSADNPTVFAIQPVGEAEALVGTRAGLFRCGLSACAPVSLVQGKTMRSLRLERQGAEEVLWVGIEGEGLRQIEGILGEAPRWSEVWLTRGEGLPNNVVLALHRSAVGDPRHLWIGTGRGVARWDGNRLSAWSSSEPPKGMVWAFADGEDRLGNPVLYAALRPGGLLEIDARGCWRLHGTAAGLPDDSALALLADRGRAALWIGTVSGGLARMEPDRWATLDERVGLPDRAIVGVGLLPDRKGHDRLGVGTSRGAVVWQDNQFAPLLPPALRFRRVHAVAVLADGSRWVATERGVLVLDDAGVRSELTVDNSALPAVWVYDLVRRRDAAGAEEVWIATGHGLARWRADRGVELWRGFGDQLAGAPVRGLAVADARAGPGETLWVAQGDRLFELRPEGLRDHHACLGSAPVEDLAADAEQVWVVTRLRVFTVDPNGRCTDVNLPRAAGQFTHVAVSRTHVHVFGTQGAWRLARDGGPPVHLDIADGLLTRELAQGNTVVVDGTGRVFAGTTAGLAVWTPVSVRPPQVKPALLLEARRLGDPDEPLADGSRLPAAAADVRFRFRLIDYAREHRIAYQVQLEGLEVGPRPWSRDSQLDYQRLPPGVYRLVVRARDADGGLHGPATFSLTVMAPAWQHPWALVGYAFALVLVGVGLGFGRVRMLRARAAALENLVHDRTRELAEANARLAEAALTDALTTLRNRRFLMLELPEEVERCLRRVVMGQADADLLLILLDIDHFKAVNDRYGHEAGDRVLMAVARRLKGVVREGDFALRWGGEEFLLVLRDFDRRGAAMFLPRLLAAVAGPVEVGDGVTVAITVSAGAVAFPLIRTNPRALPFQTALRVADVALYRAKEGGRDQAILAVWDEHAPTDSLGLQVREYTFHRGVEPQQD